MKRNKKIFAAFLVIALMIIPCSNAFAYDLEVEIRTGNFTGSNDIMLNCYTSGAVQSGTQVSTWSRTSNYSQLWMFRTESNGYTSVRSLANRNVAINANRSYIGTTVNVITASTNILADYTFISMPSEYANGAFILAARGGHVYSVYLTRSGNANLCTWQYNNSSSNQKWQWSSL